MKLKINKKNKWFSLTTDRFQLAANSLPKGVRYIGFNHEQYDGHYYCLGFWWFHVYIYR